jgi:hypothetical protein
VAPGADGRRHQGPQRHRVHVARQKGVVSRRAAAPAAAGRRRRRRRPGRLGRAAAGRVGGPAAAAGRGSGGRRAGAVAVAPGERGPTGSKSEGRWKA